MPTTPTPAPLLAADLLALLLDPDSGKPRTDATRLDLALAGALLLELSVDERIGVTGDGRRARLVVVDGRPTQDELLDDAVRVVGERNRRPDHVVPRLGKGLRGPLLSRLESEGRVRRERRRVLGLFPADRWYPIQNAHDRDLARRLHDVLVVGTTPDTRTTALIALLASIDAAWRVVGATDRRTRRDVQRRAKELTEGNWAAAAVRRAVQAVQAAVAASTTAAVTAATTASS